MARLPHISALAALSAALLGGPLAAAAQTVQIDFPAEHRYADAGRSMAEVERTERALQAHFEALAARHLRPGDALQVTLRDIDLAGEVRAGRKAWSELRVLRGRADAPSLSFAYRLAAADGRTAEGDVRLTDLGYLQAPIRADEGATLAHERRLLQRWFTTTFGPAP